jgi:mannose-binding lectin
MIITAQSTGTHSTNSGSWTPIPGLAIKLPRGVNESVLVILNIPNPYATGNDFPGGNFGIEVDGVVQSAIASFTYNDAQPVSTGRIPTTLMAVTSLNQQSEMPVLAVWSGVRGSTVHIDSPATLAAII